MNNDNDQNNQNVVKDFYDFYMARYGKGHSF
jgi:hypothetical protein